MISEHTIAGSTSGASGQMPGLIRRNSIAQIQAESLMRSSEAERLEKG